MTPVGLQIRVFLPQCWAEVHDPPGRVYRPSYGAQPGTLRLSVAPPIQMQGSAMSRSAVEQAASSLLHRLTPEGSGPVLERKVGRGMLGALVSHRHRHPRHGPVQVWCAVGAEGLIVASYETGSAQTAARELADAEAIMESAHLAELDLTGMHEAWPSDFATVIERTPCTLPLATYQPPDWEDVSNYNSDEEPYRFRRRGAAAGETELRIWCGRNRAERIACDAAEDVVQFLRRHARHVGVEREYMAESIPHELGPFATMAGSHPRLGVVQTWLLANPHGYIFGVYTGRDVDRVAQDMKDCTDVMVNATIDEKSTPSQRHAWPHDATKFDR